MVHAQGRAPLPAGTGYSLGITMKPTFLHIIQVYQLEGMVALGKMLNPGTNTITKNMDHARYVVDALEILSEKTKGNLSSEEASFLENTLTTMRLNYVQETGSPSIAPSGDLA